ncbi:hypothetical protein Efla_004888 [Eimeria flavescens]
MDADEAILLHVTSSGVLPVTRLRGEWHGLFYNATGGPKAGFLTDFGGRREFIDKSSGLLSPPPLPSGIRPAAHTLESLNACAARELYEETAGLWGLAELLKPPVLPRQLAGRPPVMPATGKKKKKKTRNKGRMVQTAAGTQNAESLSVEHEGGKEGNEGNEEKVEGGKGGKEEKEEKGSLKKREDESLGNTEGADPIEELVGYSIRSKYRCSMRHFPELPSSLYCNLRGEEGVGAERNRRFFVLNMNAQREAWEYKDTYDNPRSSPPCTGGLLPPLHIRLHARPEGLYKKQREFQLKEKTRKSDFHFLLPAHHCRETDPHATAHTGALEAAFASLSLNHDKKRKEKENKKKEEDKEKENKEDEEKKKEKEEEKKKEEEEKADSSTSALFVGLEQLLPTRHCVLSSSSDLKVYLRRHTEGLLLRCKALQEEEIKTGKVISFVGSFQTAAALMKTELW